MLESVHVDGKKLGSSAHAGADTIAVTRAETSSEVLQMPNGYGILEKCRCSQCNREGGLLVALRCSSGIVPCSENGSV